MPRLAFLYFFRQHLGLAGLVLGCIFLIILLGQFAELARFPSGGGDRTLLTLLRAPSLMQAALPHIVLISSALTVARAGQRLEIAVLIQNGLTPARLLFPVVSAAFCIGLAFTLLVQPLASRAFNASEAMIRQTGDIALDSDRRNPREIMLWWNDGAMYVLIGHVDHAGNRLHDVTVIQVDTRHQLRRWLKAPDAVQTPEGWRLLDAAEIFAAEAAAFPPPSDLRFAFADEALAERFDTRSKVPLYSLPARIRLGRLVGAPTVRIEMQFLQLLTLPVLLGAVSLLAGAIVLRPSPWSGWKGDAVLVLATAFLVYTFSTVLDALGVRGVVRPPIAVLTLPMLCLGAGVVLLWFRDGSNHLFRRHHRAGGATGALA